MSFCMDCGAPEGKAHGSNCATHERGDAMNRSEAVKRLHNELDAWPKPSTLRAEVPEIPGWRWEDRAAKVTLERRDASGFAEVITETDWRANYYHFKHAKRMPDAWTVGEERMAAIGLNGNDGAHYLTTSAAEILRAGLGHMEDRAATYDKPAGERSMAATVRAFAATTGIELTEEQGWHFMTLLKLVRSQQGALRMDSYEDGAAYFGLMGEAAAKERG